MTNYRLPETYDPAFHGDLNDHPYLGRLEYRSLGKTGLRVSQIGLGTAVLGNLFGTINREEGIAATQEAIKSGINYVDTAPFYNTSQDVLGDALRDVPRNTYYLATKVGREWTDPVNGRFDILAGFDFSASSVLKSLERSLERLGLPYVDVVQIHDCDVPGNREILLKETIPALESAVKAGKARFIGITGYDLDFLKSITDEAKVDTVLSFSRYNLHDVSLLDYLDVFESKGVGVVTAAALAQGLLTTQGPPAWHYASEDLKIMTKKAVQLAQETGTSIEEASLGFSLRSPDPRIATSLVSIPTLEILKQNMEAATRPRTSADEKLYEELRGVFGHQNNSWVGVEPMGYQKALAEKQAKQNK
jgi:aryl-alcohol dehydrogenase-like predicted oxidoreductase